MVDCLVGYILKDLQTNMNVYICKRYSENSGESWMGALIIAAPNEEEAIQIFNNREYEDGPPKEVVKMDRVEAAGTARVLYDDDMR